MGSVNKSDSLRISALVFKAGPSPTSATPLDAHLGPVVVLVGPNNSGKSLTLREIENWCFGADELRKVVSKVVVDFPKDSTTGKRLMEHFKVKPLPTDNLRPGDFKISQFRFRDGQTVTNATNETIIGNFIRSNNEHELRNYFTAWYTIRLDGRTRFNLVNDQPSNDLLAPPTNHLIALFLNDEARKRVRDLTYEAFKLYFVIDPTGMQQFRIRMSEVPPQDADDEQSLGKKAREFLGAAKQIDQFSDGVQAFVGLISAILSLDHKIILIDEPEAFLFPPLARRLGSNLAEIAKERKGTLIAATHSAEFLIGCLEKVDVSVVRLTYQNSSATARNLPAKHLREMMKDPMLRSTRVLDALFHQAVIVTEADTDRAFYSEINRRLQEAHRGIEDPLFLNAQNKQTEYKLVSPLRQIGVPVAAVIDLDLLEDSGTIWSNLLSSALVPEEVISQLDFDRSIVQKAFPSTLGQMRAIKKDGLRSLEGENLKKAEALLVRLAEYGLFLVPCGQVENWLKGIGAKGHGPDWLIEMFTRLGTDEASETYIQPSPGDVWDFMGSIAAWTSDPGRKGT